MSLKSKIENLIGPYSNIDALNQWLQEGAKYIADHIPSSKLEAIAKVNNTFDIQSGPLGDTYIPMPISVDGRRILKGTCAGNDAIFQPSNLYNKLTNPNSIYYATNSTPALCIYNGGAVVLPAGILFSYVYPQNIDCTKDSIDNFLPEYEFGVILYAAIKAAISNLKSLSLIPPDLSTITPPTLPSDPNFQWTNATVAAYFNSTVGDLGPAPQYTSPLSNADFISSITALNTDTEDTELAQVQITKERAQLEEYQLNIQNQLNVFNQQNVAYQANLQKLIENARLGEQTLIASAEKTSDIALQNSIQKSQVQIAQYRSFLERYQNQVQQYQALVMSTVQKYQSDVQALAIQQKELLSIIATLKNELAEYMQVNFNVSIPVAQPNDNQNG